MSARQKLIAFCIIGLFILPNLYVIIRGTESFPFTCCPMFGHYIGESTYLYHIRFVGLQGTVEKEIFPVGKTIPTIWTMRLFFNKVYGSMESYSPFGDHPDDSSQALEERMEVFFATYFDPLLLPVKSEQSWNRIKVEVNRYDSSHQYLSTHVIGYYDLQAKNFTHTWEKKSL